MIHELAEDEDARPNLQVVDWSPDGKTIYMTYSAPDKYDRGLVRFDPASKSFSDLRRSDRLTSRWRMSEDGTTFVFAESDGDVPDDLYAADSSFAAVRRLTDVGADYFAWADDGRTVTWAVGATFFKVRSTRSTSMRRSLDLREKFQSTRMICG